jgi:hypothetical protein
MACLTYSLSSYIDFEWNIVGHRDMGDTEPVPVMTVMLPLS